MTRLGPVALPAMTRWFPFLIAVIVFALDRASKAWIEANVQFWETHTIIPGFFQIVHTRNKGIAFGIFNDSGSNLGSWLLVAFSVGVLIFVFRLLWRQSEALRNEHWSMTLALALVLGGALGNVYDRLRFGSVTDFLDFFWGSAHFPVFNVADSAITVGACLLLLNLWWTRNTGDQKAPPVPSERV